MNNDFEINGKKFKLSKINALKQFHIVRKIGPILTELLPALQELQKSDIQKLSENENLESLSKFVTPIMNGLSKLSDAEADKVLYGLLSSVEVQQPAGNWSRVSTDTMLMMQDMELPILLQIAGRAFMFNLSGFFAVLPQH